MLDAERALGRRPQEMPTSSPGHDIRSYPSGGEPSIVIKVKAQPEGADDFFATPNEIFHGKNTAPRYRLAMVSVSPLGPQHDQVRYVGEPFTGTELGTNGDGMRLGWVKTWTAGNEPW